ncbi:hypothetical protein ACFO3D_13745 [Virgibacillus kekensis]|uniref:Uncharacterized protein n=1 Tax=Virgibacillus kekensis TaxID=202261 RepID=A0ABV9DLP5_9BACI
MDTSTIMGMILGIVLTWGIPIAIVVAIITLFKKVSRLEKNLMKNNNTHKQVALDSVEE